MAIKVNPKTHCIYDTNGSWYPPISIKQLEIFDDYHRYLLVQGPKFASKTRGVLHKICRHAFDFPARIGIITKTTKVGKVAGVWQELTASILPIWEKANTGFRLTMPPKVTGDTRQNMFKVLNRFGAESEVYLHSLEYAPEVEEKLKGTEYTMLWFSEIDQIAPEPEHRIVLAMASDTLRGRDIPFEAYQIIMDCNPPDSGPHHWLHDIFFKEKERPDHPDPWYQQLIHRIDFQISDNPFLDARQIADLKARYSYRQSLYNRFILGKWEEDLMGGHFTEMFREETHLRGEIHVPVGERTGLVPGPTTRFLISGFDPGDKNNAFVILSKRESDDKKERPEFDVIDELVTIDKSIPLRDFVDAMVEMILKWEKFCMDNYKRKIQWRHYSDTSAWRFKSAAEAHEALLVYNFSGGKIQLVGAPKYKGSLRDRVRLVQELLYEKRILISAQLKHTITMLKVLRKGESAAEYVTPKEHTHIFSALTYALQSEVPLDEIVYSNATTGKTPPKLVLA